MFALLLSLSTIYDIVSGDCKVSYPTYPSTSDYFKIMCY